MCCRRCATDGLGSTGVHRRGGRAGTMAELIEPTVRLHAAWLAAHEEWGPGLHEDGFGLGPDDDVDSHVGFAAWVAELNTGAGVYRWIVEDGQVLGGITLRPEESEYVRWAGHLGY